MFRVLRRFFVFQDVVSWVVGLSPPVLEHNVGKYLALKKAFYLTALDGVTGDYLEFGVFTGGSFVAALRSERQMRRFGSQTRFFYGFDSFSGFGTVKTEDRHPFYQTDTFTVSEKKVRQFINGRCDDEQYVKIVSGYFDESIKGKTARQSQAVKQARVVLIDCDMKEPARLALDYVRDSLQPGTIIVLDDYHSYRSQPDKGVQGAFLAFLKKNKRVRVQELFTYGYGGKAFIVTAC